MTNDTPAPLSATAPAPAVPYNLRALFQAIGGFSGERALAQAPPTRTDADIDVELIDTTTSEITCPPLPVAGFVDGIQNAITVSYRGHRPVYLAYAAAGAVGPDGRAMRILERLELIGSVLDGEWITGVGPDLPFTQLNETRPDLLAADAAAHLRTQRDDLEKIVVEQLTSEGVGPLVVDGSLVGRPTLDALVGVVKTTTRRYLPDESVLWGMPVGWRSPRFKMPAGSQGVARDRYSCYLRLQDASRHAWDFGLIRLETFELDLLEPLAALAVSERQSSRSGDARFDRHLAGVRAVEQVLRARRPDVFHL